MMKKSDTKKKKKRQIKIGFWGYFFIILFLILLFRVIKTETEITRLANDGIQTNAFVYARADKNHFYRFYYPNWMYKRIGESYLGKVGDSICVIFLKDNPDVNRNWDDVKKRKKAKERVAKGELHP